MMASSYLFVATLVNFSVKIIIINSILYLFLGYAVTSGNYFSKSEPLIAASSRQTMKNPGKVFYFSMTNRFLKFVKFYFRSI
jgi:hypothetical protein